MTSRFEPSPAHAGHCEPIFVVGSVRSGTTLLGLMLDSHPDIAFPGEFEFAIAPIGDDGAYPPIEEFHAWLASDRHFRWHRLEIDSRLDYPALLASFLEQLRAARGPDKPRVGVAVHRRIDRLPDLWPHSRYIHIVRDPRDVTASIIARGWCGNHYTAAQRWRRAELEWDACRARLPDDRVFELHYERLVCEPVEALAELCSFLGLAYAPAMLSYHLHSRYGPPDPSLAQRWRDRLPARSVRLVERAAGDLLERRGYPRRFAVDPPFGRIRSAALRAHCRASTFVFRTRRYGLGLRAARRLTGMFGLRGLHEKLRLREHAITNLHLK